MAVIKKDTITINEDRFAEASAKVLKRLLHNSEEFELDTLEKEVLKALCLNFSGELYLELFVEVTKEDNKEE